MWETNNGLPKMWTDTRGQYVPSKALLGHFAKMEVDSIRKIREELLNDYEEYNNDSIELLWDLDAKIWAKENSTGG